MQDENQSKRTEEVSVRIVSDNMETLRNTATLLGFTEQQALNQAVWLWTVLASQGWVGRKVSITTTETLPNKKPSPRKQAMIRLLGRIGIEVTSVRTCEWTLPLELFGTSSEELTEETLRKLRQED